MENVPDYVNIIFLLTTLFALFIFSGAANKTGIFTGLAVAWIALQSLLAYKGIYTYTATMPPPFLLAILPPLLFIAALFLFPAGRRFIDSLRLEWLTVLHVIRIPVEIILFLLYMHKLVPQAMTFEGHNYDILSGLTAPVIYYLVFKKAIGSRYLLLWNIICLVLLLNIVGTAILSAPFRFQQLGFEQPNIAILYFPFVLLPSFIVPLVLFSHLAAIRKILLEQKRANSSIVV